MAGTLRIHRPAADVKAATIAALAMGNGRLHAPDYATADVSGWCEAALIVDQMGYGHMRMGPGGRATREGARTLSLKVRCRRCDGCIRERRKMWTERAAREWRQASRTWFVTLTLRPEDHYKLQTRVRQRLASQGANVDAMPARDRLAEFLRDYKREMDLYLMRLRKGLAGRGWPLLRFRYLWVPEPHKSGAIHFHLLLHEVSPDMPIRKERIEATWGLGFVSAKLVKSEDAARYVTKYLGKFHFEGRLRASVRYGELEKSPEAMRADPAFPGHVAAEPPQPLPQHEAERRAATRAELGSAPGSDDEEETEEVQAGDELGACPSGMHFGVRCRCEFSTIRADPDPWGTERGDLLRPVSGVPKRRWQVKGWHQPDPANRGMPGVPRGPRKRKVGADDLVH